MSADPIREVTCVECSVPLPHPLTVGPATVTRRTYAVLRLRTEGGLEGTAYGFSRGLPVAAIVQRAIAPLLLGADSSLPELVRGAVAGAYWPYAEQGLFSVAASVVDLALWDLRAKRMQAPLADLLGRVRTRVPACAVGGYKRQGQSGVDGIGDEMARYVALGCEAVKLAIGADDPATDARRVAAVREAVGPDCAIVVDAFRSFRNLDDALRRLRLLERYDLAYVEDPFAESLAPLVADLRRASGMMIGLGENLGGHRAFAGLIASGAVDVVRCDATVVGGVREFMATAALASARGLELSAHVHADVHVHFGAALGNLHRAGLEYMDPAAGLDGLHELLHSTLAVSGGAVTVPPRPGLGLDWNWDAVARYADG